MGKTLIKVETYSGYKADERPRAFFIRDKVLKVMDVLDQWYGEGSDYFKIKANDGCSYIIRHDRNTDEWDLVMMEAGSGRISGSEGRDTHIEEGSEAVKTYDFNLLVSHSWRTFRQTKDEITRFLKDFGDKYPVVEKTVARGICGVRTSLDAREVIRRVRALYEENPTSLSYTIRWVPADNWCAAGLEEMKKTLEKEKGKIRKGENWAMKVEKRRYTELHSIDIIRELAELIDEKVDLRNPDKVVRVEILGRNACISVIKPDEVFSTGRPF